MLIWSHEGFNLREIAWLTGRLVERENTHKNVIVIQRKRQTNPNKKCVWVKAKVNLQVESRCKLWMKCEGLNRVLCSGNQAIMHVAGGLVQYLDTMILFIDHRMFFHSFQIKLLVSFWWSGIKLPHSQKIKLGQTHTHTHTPGCTQI